MAQNLNFNLTVDTNSAVSSINQFFNTFDQGAAKAKNQLNQAFGQTLETNIQINLKDGELVAKKIQNINQESKKLETAVNAINGKWGKTPNELKRQLNILKQIQGDTRKYQGDTQKLTSDWQQVTQRIEEASFELKRMTQGGPMKQLQSGLTGILGKFALVQTAANLATGAIMGMARGVGDFAATAGRMEVLQLQLEAFAGGAQEARDVFNEFVDIAAKTPFNLEQVAQAGKIMMAFGVETDTAVKATEQLGIVAAATGGDVNLLARNLGQIAAQGQAYTRDLTQFAIQGIPIWEEMSKVTGASVQELKKMASEGKISFDIVQSALDNLTASGSRFSMIAERMQETFQGRMARIEAAMQKLALEFINGFNSMDRAMGGLVSGSMKLFADSLFAIANNMQTIMKVLGTLTAATIAYFTVANWGTIVGAIKAVRTAIIAVTTAQNAANVAATVFAALTGNWVGIAAAVAVGGAAYVGLSLAMNRAKESSDGVNQSVSAGAEAIGILTAEETAYFEGLAGQFKEKMELYKQETAAMAQKRTELEKELEVLKTLRAQVKEKYDTEIAAIRRTMEADRRRQQEVRSAHQDRMAEINERYDAELAVIDAAIGRLREKTKEEQKLYDFEKKQLQEKIKSGTLDEEALLRAKARLSRMEQQEKIQGLVTKKTKVQAEKDKEITKAKKDQKTALDEIKESLDQQKDQIDALTAQRDKELKLMDDTSAAAKNILDNVDLTNASVSEQVSLVQDLAMQYQAAEKRALDLAAALRQAAAAQRELNSARGGGGGGGGGGARTVQPGTLQGNLARASGGPVSGGTTYQVNELGKEAFLSAAGRLSMINAPAFGNWTAPTSGTVIPAHLTKQLNVPTGGVNLNSAASSNAFRAGGGASRIRQSGDVDNSRVTNHVTIQSASPIQAASEIMVAAAKRRRRRFR